MDCEIEDILQLSEMLDSEFEDGETYLSTLRKVKFWNSMKFVKRVGVHWPRCLKSFPLPPFILSILEAKEQVFRKVLAFSENANFDADFSWFFWIKSMHHPAPNTFLSCDFDLFLFLVFYQYFREIYRKIRHQIVHDYKSLLVEWLLEIKRTLILW